MDKYGFPRTTTKKFKRVHGFQTGDMVKVIVPNEAGAYKRERKVSSGANTAGATALSTVGRETVRTSGNFNLKTKSGTIQGISYRHCFMLHRSDGYTYERRTAFLPS
jgi:hypothetical protein